MGKKANQTSQKAPKGQEKQLHSQIKVLKPKVYITDSSNFKQLVQELTGCGGGSTEILSQIIPAPQYSDNIPVIDISNHASYGSEFESCCEVYRVNEEVMNCPAQMDDGMTLDLSAYKSLELWLLDLESYNWYEGFPKNEEQINIFDYDLTGFV